MNSDFTFEIENSSDKKNEPVRIKNQILSKFREWCTDTTSHGIGRIVERNRFYSKFIWLIFTLISLALCAYMVYRTFHQYFEFDVTTKIRKEIQKNAPFPVVSICNRNPMVTSEASDYIRDYFNTEYNFNVTSYEELLGNLSNINRDYNAEINWLIYQTYNVTFNDTLRKSFGYPVDTMIFSSTFYDSFLNVNENFDWYYDFTYGNCFRFNSKPRSDGSYYGLEFSDDGLTLDLFVGLPESIMNYFYQLDTVGFLILIQDQGSFPIMKRGTFIKPGTFTQIEFGRVSTEMREKPFSDCVKTNDIDTIMSRHMSKINLKYTHSDCDDLLMVKIGADDLGCYDQRLPQLFDAKPCSTFSTYYKLNHFKYNYTNYDQYCPIQCESIHFETKISSTDFPSKNYYKSALYNYKDVLEKIFRTSNVTLDMYKQSFARVAIHIGDLKITHITESASMNVPDLLASVGGTCGLFIGVSILSFVELIELAFDIGIIIINRMFFSKK